jgi:hypothetical protein
MAIRLSQLTRKKRSEFTYPELLDAEKEIRKIPLSPGGKRPTLIRGTQESIEAFGEKNMKDPEFKRQLRKLHEKYKLTAYA